MAGPRYEAVKVTFWDEGDMEEWPPTAYLLYLYLLTSPLSNGITGIWSLTAKQTRNHTSLNTPQIDAAWEAIGQRVLHFDGSWLWVRAQFRHRCHSPNHFKACCKHLRENVPPAIRQAFVEYYRSSETVLELTRKHRDLQGLWEGLEGLCKGFPPTPTPSPTPSPTPVPKPIPTPSPSPKGDLIDSRSREGHPSGQEQIDTLNADVAARQKGDA